MPRISIWWKLAAVGLVGYLAAAVFLGPAEVRAQKDDKDKGKKDKGKEEEKIDFDKPGPKVKAYFGIAACRNGVDDGGCHNRAVNKPMNAEKRSLVCRSNEIKFWQAKDKHSLAYKVLIADLDDAKKYAENERKRYDDDDWEEREKAKLNDTPEQIVERNKRARDMLAILKKTDKHKDDPTYKLTTDPDCLACHAQVVSKADKDAGVVTDSFNVEEGVNCVVCHGAYSNWRNGHVNDGLNEFKRWRAITREDKEKVWGMTDLWNPVNRTKVCASCHIGGPGDAAKGEHPRFVTHEMYAAGHPPLPSFEVAAFSNEEPRHWDYLRAKNDKILAAQKIDRKDFAYEQTQLVLIGAATSLSESMRLLVEQAKTAADPDKPLDWSNFDCYACHHQLEKDAWRQQRGYGKNRPGRLPMRPWTVELVKLAIGYVAKDDKDRDAQMKAFDAQTDAVREAFTARNMGHPEKIKTEAAKMQAWAEGLAKAVNAKLPNDKEAATRAYKMIPTVYEAKTPADWLDFDSARQIGWGFKTIYYDVKRYNWNENDAKAEKDPSEKIEKKENTGKDDPVLKVLAGVEELLRLKLPVSPRTIIDDLEETSNARNKYKPKEFDDKLKELAKSLEATK